MLNVWDPFADFGRLSNELERNLFGARGGYKLSRGDFAPVVDIYEEKDALVVSAELPGVKREDIEISIDGDVLTLKGDRAFQKEESEKRYHRVERSYGAFARHFKLPASVDAEKVEASLADGVLKVRLPKKDVAKSRKIEVRNN